MAGNIGTGEPNAAMRLLIYLGEPGSAIIDDLSIVAGTNAGVGPTNTSPATAHASANSAFSERKP